MSEADFKTKYLKYKKKYLDLKSQIEGGSGSVFSSKKVFYAGLLQKNSPFQEIRGTFRDGFFEDSNEIAMYQLKKTALVNGFKFMSEQNGYRFKITEEEFNERMESRGLELKLAPYKVYPILLDPLPRLAKSGEITLDFINDDDSPVFVRNIENEQELYDAFNQKDKFGSLYTGAERKVENLKVLMAVTENPQWPRLFSGPYALKGIKHPVIKIDDPLELRTWIELGLTLSEKLKNDDLIAEYIKKNGRDPSEEYYEKNKKEIDEFYKKARRKFNKLPEWKFDEWYGDEGK